MSRTRFSPWVILLWLAVLTPLYANGAAELVRTGIADSANHDYAKAERAFQSALAKDPRSAASAYDLGTAQFHQGKYVEALRSFRKAEVEDTASAQLQAKASYNQGETLAKMGDAAVSRAPASALDDYRKGIDSFERSLEIDPSLKNAGYNIEVLRRRIRKIEQQKRSAPGQSVQSRSGSSAKGSSSSSIPRHSGSPRQTPDGGAPPSHSPQASGQFPPSSGSNARKYGMQSAHGSSGATQPKVKGGVSKPGKGFSGTGGVQTPQAPSAQGQYKGVAAPGPTAQEILGSERNHPRMNTLDNQQVPTDVAQDW